jgi:hypothetical protein
LPSKAAVIQRPFFLPNSNPGGVHRRRRERLRAGRSADPEPRARGEGQDGPSHPRGDAIFAFEGCGDAAVSFFSELAAAAGARPSTGVTASVFHKIGCTDFKPVICHDPASLTIGWWLDGQLSLV